MEHHLLAQEPLEGVGLHPKVRNGFLLYPPRPGDGDEPVPSMRWELMWEGLEARTLECLSLLERLVSRSRDEGLKKRALALLYRIKRAFPRFPLVSPPADQPYLLDPFQYERWREEISALIEAFLCEPNP